MRRKLFTIAAAVSLALCVAGCVLWCMSQFDGYGAIFWSGEKVNYAVASKRQWLVFGTEPRRPHRGSEVMVGDMPLWVAFPRNPVAGVPHWGVVLGSAVLPAAWVMHRRRKAVAAKRIARGECAACGYDLRATPGRCPECGATRLPHHSPAQRTATASSGAAE
jgi:hypothetical protein